MGGSANGPADGPADGGRGPGHEPHGETMGSRLNRLRAGVLGAQDGVVSTAGLVVGVAGATTDVSALLVAGVAGLFSGALSMGAGEYVSVSTQRDTERAAIAQEKRELAEEPEAELDELAGLYERRGLTPELARQVAVQLTEKDALRAHAEVELKLDTADLTSPWQAALASFTAFSLGALIPLVAVVSTPVSLRVPVTFVSVLCAVALTGTISARLGGAPPVRAALRCIVGGAVAMAATYGIGTLIGSAGG